ncbi:hypothetical protein N9025_02060 [Synechococcus sp. AH-707-B22]|nr:hypothetical protein [Synechococcus sp. AH-707-B22]
MDETNRRHDPEPDSEDQAGDRRVIHHEEELWRSCRPINPIRTGAKKNRGAAVPGGKAC